MSGSVAKSTTFPVKSTVRRPLTILPPLFANLSDIAKARIKAAGYTCSLQKNEVLVRAGEMPGDVLLVQSGWLVAELDNVCVSLLAPNSLYFLYALEAKAAVCDLFAVASNTSVAVLDKSTLWSVLEESPSTLAALCDNLVQQIGKAQVATARRVNEPLERRLAHLLWETGVPSGGGARRIPNMIPQKYMASYLGASREEISRKRGMLVDTGCLVERDGEWYMEQPPLKVYTA
jgi:CRP-like cAMP-binding protein